MLYVPQARFIQAGSIANEHLTEFDMPQPSVFNRTASCFCWTLLLVLGVIVRPASGQNLSIEKEGSSSREYREQALGSIPYAQLNQETKEKISDILQKPSLYRRLPATAIQADPEYYRFLVRYPEVIVSIWQLMGVTQMTTERTGPYSLKTDDGAGTISNLELIYGNDTMHIFYGQGTYEGPVIHRKLRGRCVLILNTLYTTDGQGQPQATSELDVFLKVDNSAVGLIAKSLQSLVGRTADHNFIESLKFVGRLNETTTENGPGVQQMATRLQIDPEIQRKFAEIAGKVYERSSQPAAARPAPPARLPHNEMMAVPITVPVPASSRNPQPASSYQGSYTPADNSFSAPAPPIPRDSWPRSGAARRPPIVSPGDFDSSASGGVRERIGDGGWRVASRPDGYQAPHYAAPYATPRLEGPRTTSSESLNR